MSNMVLMLVIGAIAGWIAGQMQHGDDFGTVGNIFVGVMGAALGGFISDKLGISLGGGLVGALITATLGAILLLYLIKVFRGEVEDDE